MNAERLLAHFETISEAPDAIARLRRFILDLAVRGKLVEQDPEDEPAEELLKAISLDSLQSKGRRTTAAAFPGIAIKGSFAVPDSWVWTLLGGIGDWGSGSTPPRGRADYYSGDISWFKSGELGDNKSLSDSEEKITHLALGECSFRNNKPGDILIAMYGATIGKLAILAEEAVTNQAVCACTPCWGVDTQYLYLFLLAKRDDFRLASEGGAQPNISKVKIVNTPIPLPPLAEQHRIVAKVDELMALCDQLEAARQERERGRERLVAATLQRLNEPDEDPASFRHDARFALQVLPSLASTAAQIKQLRQTILNLAVRGKLVEQDSEDEPAEQLLNCIMRLKNGAPLAPSDESPLPFHLPTGWVSTTLRSLVVSSNSGWSPKTLDTPREGDEWGILKVSAVSWDHFRSEANKQVLPSTQPRPQAVLRKGDFLISRANTAELVARAVIVDMEPINLMMSDKIVRLELVELCEPKFILIANNHWSFARAYYAERATGVSPSMKNVTRDVILDLPIPLPPLAEQHSIVAKVGSLMALCDQLEQQLSQADQQRRKLLEAVLAEALEEPEKALASLGSS